MTGSTRALPAAPPSLLLPWNLLTQDVFWLAVDILIFGTLTMRLAYT